MYWLLSAPPSPPPLPTVIVIDCTFAFGCSIVSAASLHKKFLAFGNSFELAF